MVFFKQVIILVYTVWWVQCMWVYTNLCGEDFENYKD